ncbi:hypothetical protein CCAX7_60320 [Capsulimonas corticalis]|uniref:Uncharacterized protein n=1 Tax=Capsulimonas corticalis TaxID=2219043 RepID=A0A9N7QEP9_9BACT|nr:hypothetical protein CCAX7_60320 [Capsulimonas corticalis]
MLAFEDERLIIGFDCERDRAAVFPSALKVEGDLDHTRLQRLGDDLIMANFVIEGMTRLNPLLRPQSLHWITVLTDGKASQF